MAMKQKIAKYNLVVKSCFRGNLTFKELYSKLIPYLVTVIGKHGSNILSKVKGNNKIKKKQHLYLAINNNKNINYTKTGFYHIWTNKRCTISLVSNSKMPY